MGSVSRFRLAAQRAALASLTILAVACATSQAAPRRVPFGYLGVMADGPLLGRPGALEAEAPQMVSTGVESLRFGIYWSEVQPYPNAASVPPELAARYQLIDGVPTDFSQVDRLFRDAARYGLRVLPVILQAPPWARRDPTRMWSPPADPATYGRFAGLVVGRYGPGGSFWAQNPTLPRDPARDWQIWNEPAGGLTPNGVTLFWDDPAPFQAPYIAMLQAARAQIKAADPSARIVLGGLFSRSWLALQSLYEHGARGLFDEVAVNIFTSLPRDVLVTVQRDRAVMNHNGDRALPMIISETSWPSAAGRIAKHDLLGYEVTPVQQAQRLTSLLVLLDRNRAQLNLQQVFWYTWLSRDASRTESFDYAGLRRLTRSGAIAQKPVQRAYRRSALALEGCTKTLLADAC
jgi:hypothetical protein